MTLLRYLPLVLLASLSHPALAQDGQQEGRREPVLTVLGSGKYEIKPDIARFSATVTTEKRTLGEAAKAHEERATRASAILDSLKQFGLAIEKGNFRLDERRSTQPISQAELSSGKSPRSVLEGYNASTTFSLKVTSLDKLNEVVSRLAESGLFDVSRVNFSVLQERVALNQARRAAMLDALEQAKAYSEPVDLRLGPILTITDGEARPPDGYADIPSRRLEGNYTVQIIPPAVLEFDATVNVTWRIEPK
jgi:uncharacterized protein